MATSGTCLPQLTAVWEAVRPMQQCCIGHNRSMLWWAVTDEPVALVELRRVKTKQAMRLLNIVLGACSTSCAGTCSVILPRSVLMLPLFSSVFMTLHLNVFNPSHGHAVLLRTVHQYMPHTLPGIYACSKVSPPEDVHGHLQF